MNPPHSTRSATRLSVNLNKVALLRNTRSVGVPDVLHAARLALAAGAQGITVHPRPDARHIRRQDVRDLARLLNQRSASAPQAEFNIEGNPFQGLVDIVQEVRPQQCTLVPDDESQATSDHGWDLDKDGAALRALMPTLKATGARISLFMDPAPEAMAAARALGADRVELYTEPYARAFAGEDAKALEQSLKQYEATARAALDAGLGVNAGHDLNLANLPPFLARVPGVLEVSIGHALIADALEFGMADTVRRYLQAVGQSVTGATS
ncbi:MAG TPA: pyridoxine 5'-phosphate synthase [Burkholderiales bacterium]|nr:pyridoxine 5'-phosphate synthase [Burkholderiales bacterium]